MPAKPARSKRAKFFLLLFCSQKRRSSLLPYGILTMNAFTAKPAKAPRQPSCGHRRADFPNLFIVWQ
jgi:hypothetical protein